MSNGVRQSPEARRNAVLLFAVLLEKGPITDKSGRATSILHAYLKANGYTVLRLTSLNAQMKRYEHCFAKTIHGKRTYRIELVEIPTEFEDEVAAMVPTLTLRKPRKQTNKRAVLDPVASAQTGPTPIPVVTPVPAEAPSAGDIAEQVLDLLVERLTAKPSADYSETHDTPRLLIEANQREAKLRDAYNRVHADFTRAEQTIEKLRTKVAGLEANVARMTADSQRGVGHEIAKAKASFQRQAPEGTKGSDHG